MLAVRCPSRDQRVLLGAGSILAIHNTCLGPIAVFCCVCDELGLWHSGSSYHAPGGFDPRTDPAGAADVVRRMQPAVDSD